jgi:hypothetical protein
MGTRRKKYELSDWRLTMEQVGRELSKFYRRPQRLPRRLRSLLAELRQSETQRRQRLIRKTEGKGPERH